MPLMTVRGEEVWQSAYEQGKGVILLQYHTLAGRLVFPRLAYIGVQPRLSIETARARDSQSSRGELLSGNGAFSAGASTPRRQKLFGSRRRRPHLISAGMRS